MNFKSKTLIKDTIIFAIGGIGSKFILFFMVPLYTNYLSTEEYGIADLVFTISQLIMPIVSVVIFDAVIRFGLSKDEKAEEVLLCAFVVLAVGTLITTVITPIIGLYSPLNEWKWYMCIYIAIGIANSIELNYLKVKNKNKMYAAMSIIQTFVMAILNITFLAFMRLGIYGYLVANIFALITGTLLIFIFGHIAIDLKRAKFNAGLMKRMICYSAPLILNNLSWWVIQSSNKIIIENIINASALGIYTTATKIPSLMNVMISIFSQAWGISSIREIETTNDYRFYANIFKYYSLFAFIACTLIIGIIKPFMAIYVGDDFSDAWKYVPLLLVSASFSAVASFFGSLYGALKKSVNNMISTCVAAFLCVGISIVLVSLIGTWGAIIGTVISYVVMALIRMVDVIRYLKFYIDWSRFVINGCVVLVQGTLVSLNFHIYIVSTIAIIIIVVTNYKTMTELIIRKRIKG